VSGYPELFVALLDSGAWAVDDLKKLAGLNFLRVFRAVEKVSLPWSRMATSRASCFYSAQPHIPIDLINTLY
jgi:hypothetical protein